MIRIAAPHDAASIADLYQYYVVHTGANFEITPPGIAEMESRIQSANGFGAWIVDDAGDEGVGGAEGIRGYAYGTRFRARDAYNWAVEVSIYMRHGRTGRGAGRRLYSTLLDILTIQGFSTAIAVIATPNDESIAFHQKLGFTHAGTLQQCGFKSGIWRDTQWWQRDLAPRTANPQPPLSAGAILRSPAARPAWFAAFETHNSR